MKADQILNMVLILMVVIILGFAMKTIFFAPDIKPIINTVIQRDTVTHIDTVKIPRTVYVTKLQAKIDTLFIQGKPSVFAKADTTLQKDSSKVNVSYFFPPLNYFEVKFDIKEKIIEKLRTITEVKTITVEEPWYKNIWFFGTIISVIILFLVR